MMNFCKQRVYDEETVKKYFLSPYADCLETTDGIYFARREKQEEFILKGDAGELRRFLDLLKDGLLPDELRQMLEKIVGNDEAEDWETFLLQEGIIE